MSNNVAFLFRKIKYKKIVKLCKKTIDIKNILCNNIITDKEGGVQHANY